MTLAACTPKFYPPQRLRRPTSYVYGAGLLGGHDGRGRPTGGTLFGDTALDSAGRTGAGRTTATWPWRPRAWRRRGPTSRACGRSTCRRSARTPRPRANIRPRRRSCSRTPSSRPSRGRWRCSGQLRNAKRAAKAEIAARRSGRWRGVQAGAGGRGRHDLLHAAGIRTRPLRSPGRACALRRESAALIDSMFRYGMSDGVALEQARSLVYTAEADIPQYCRAVEQTWLSMGILLGETPSPGAAFRSGAATADRLPSARTFPWDCPRSCSNGGPTSRQARFDMLAGGGARPGSAREQRGSRPSALTAKGGVASSSIKGLTAANPWAWDALGSLSLAPIFGFRETAPRGAAPRWRRYTQSALDLRADRADGVRRRGKGVGGHRHLPQPDRALRANWCSPTTASPR